MYFSIWGDVFEPDRITEILAIQPNRTWKKGDPIPKPVYRRNETSWRIETGYEKSYDINDQLYKLYEVLQEKVEALHRIKNDFGVSLQFMVVVKVRNEEKPAIHFQGDFIKLLHDMGADVDIDYYI